MIAPRLPLLDYLFLIAWLPGILGASAQTNGALREVYYNISGGAVSDLTNAAKFPNSPDEMFLESALESPSNFADNYGQRMRALLLPPATGSYIFWIASDDNSALYLSQDETPAHKTLIASESAWTNPRQWNLHPSQKSAAILLTNGHRYYLEALQKEGAGGDNLAVTWQKPGDAPPADGDPSIPGAYLISYGVGPPVIALQPTNLTVIEGGSATFTIQLAQKLGASYQWFRGGSALASATNSIFYLSPVALTDSGGRYSCLAVNPYGNTNSAAATLTVIPDTTRPALTSVGNLGDPQILTVIFSEPIEAATATNPGNYAISGGVLVTSAAFGADPRTIILTTSPLALQTLYTLTVNNIRDRAASPNVILPNAQRTFSLDSTPLDISFVRPPPEPIGASTRHGPLVISEIMYHPTNRLDGKNLEYLELFNSNPFSEDLSGFRVTGQVDFTFPTNTTLAARSFMVLAATPADLQSVYGIANVLGPYTNRLSNSYGTLRLLNREGGILFEAKYSGDPPWPAAADGGGHSMALARPSLGEQNPAAWAASDVVGGSPGWAESVGSNPYRTVLINEFLTHTDPPDLDYIELFNYGLTAVDLSGCVLTDDAATNKFVMPINTIIQPQGFLSFDETQLNFRLSAAGETIYLKDPNNTRVIDTVRFGAQENGVSTGRSPDGAAGFYRLQTKTPGARNSRSRVGDVVINEIMYDPISGLADDQYVELFNQTAVPVDVSCWSLADGIEFTLPHGTVLPANGYLVIAKNAARLLLNYPNLTGANTLGNFSGSLAHGGERVVLAMPDQLLTTNVAGLLVTNHINIVVDEVTYGIGGRWGKWAHGGGSSLELVDPRSDHRLAPNWVDSDETGKSGWTTIEYTGVLDNGNGTADSLQIIMLGSGECLVDNVEVFAAGGQNLVSNPGFESGLAGWVPQGNHENSAWESGTGYNGSACLHVRATDHGDTGANRIRTSLASTLTAGQTATLRAKVRWLAGSPEILLRLKGNWLEAAGNILASSKCGTPGAPNSQARPNLGPAITDVKHSPVLPTANQSVTVIARVHDPDGLAGLVLKYRLDPSTNLNLVTMVNNGAGLFSAVIPGQAAGGLVGFHIQALDNFSPRGVSQFPSDAPVRECLVRWGDPVQSGSFGTYRVWMTQATLDRWSTREHLSNQPLDCTFIYGNSRVIYNIGGEYSGSPWHAPGYNSPLGNVCDYLLTFPDDDPLLGETDATLQMPGNGGGDNTYQREETAYWIAEQMGLPYCYRRLVNLFVNGVRRSEMYEDVQQPNGNMTDEFYPNGTKGDLHKIQLWYEFDDAAATFNTVGASLQNVTTAGGQKKLPFYRWTFAKRAVRGSASNYTNLFALVDAANFNGLGADYRRQLEATVDVDNWLKTYAVEHIVGNNDSFAYGGGQNMYTYKPSGDTWKMMIWDIDFAFASQDPSSDAFQGIGRSNGIDLSEPAYSRRYWQILQDLANGPLSGTKLNPLVDAKYNALVANGRTIDNPVSIKTYVSQRQANLLNLIATNVPAAFALTLNNGAGFSTNRNQLSLAGTAPIEVRSITINGVAFPVIWTSVSNWTVQVALAAGVNSLNLQGWGAAGGLVSGATATVNITNTASVDLPQGKVAINEIMYHPGLPNASFVEFYNSSQTTAFDLSGWRLGGADFVFPGGTIIGPNAFLVVAGDRVGFAAAYGAKIPLVGEFAGAFQNGGETLRLIKPGATPAQDLIVDELRYASQAPWPVGADGTGSSLQLIDPRLDNWRAGNWLAVQTNLAAAPQWMFVSTNITASSSTIYLYLQSAGDVFLDDVSLVGASGTNVIVDGDFESPLTGPWNLTDNFVQTSLSPVVKHSGNSGLHLVATAAGSGGGNAVYQFLNPPLNIGQAYTLSYWYFQSTNGGPLTVRLASSVTPATVNPAPQLLFPNQAIATPGATNSIFHPLAPFPPLWINELQADNATGITNGVGQSTAWLELYNPTTNLVSLGGLYLARDYANLRQWGFPSNAVINPGQFKVIFADGRSDLSTLAELHTSFTLASGAGSVALSRLTTNAEVQVLDYVDYTNLAANHSFGSLPDGQSFSRQELFYATPGGTNEGKSPPLSVFINEWMADNQTTLTDPADDHFDDWIEIYNPGDAPADLSGFYLGQNLTNKAKFQIPEGYIIRPHGFLLVWADNEPSQNSSNHVDLHANFKLAKAGESIGLFAADGTVIDFVSFGPQTTDVSEGRFPDGAAAIAPLTQPTPRAANWLALPNGLPVISPLPDRDLIEGQLLLFTASATDTNIPAQHLTFSLDAGAPTNSVIDPVLGLFSWRPLSAQSPSTNLITVLVTDDGVPPMSASSSFTVRVGLPPKVTAVVPNRAGGCSLSFGTFPNKTYRVEFKDTLQDSDWQPLGPDTVATGEGLTITDPVGGKSQRFYRIMVLD